MGCNRELPPLSLIASESEATQLMVNKIVQPHRCILLTTANWVASLSLAMTEDEIGTPIALPLALP